MIGLIVAVESAVSRRWRDLSDPVSLNWQFADRAARDDATGRDVLFLGDSLVKHGLVPSVFERESGLERRQPRRGPGPTLLTYFVLRRALESGPGPRRSSSTPSRPS